MNDTAEGNAIVYCEKAFNTTNGKTAHGLVRFTNRYKVLSVVDSAYAGRDAGEVLDGRQTAIPIFSEVGVAIEKSRRNGAPATHLVVGLAPDGGRLPSSAREDIGVAVRLGLHVDCGLHDYLNDDPALVELAGAHQVRLRDIRKTSADLRASFLQRQDRAGPVVQGRGPGDGLGRWKAHDGLATG